MQPGAGLPRVLSMVGKRCLPRRFRDGAAQALELPQHNSGAGFILTSLNLCPCYLEQYECCIWTCWMCVASALACLSGCMSRYLMMGAVQSSASPRAFIARLRCAAFWQLWLCTLESLPMDDVQNSRPLCSRAQWSAQDYPCRSVSADPIRFAM